MPFRIVAECTLMACCLGFALDVVTANVAVEYFTVHHPQVVDSQSPWVMALVWGIGAAWWFGALAGGVLALLNHHRKDPVPLARIRGWMIQASLRLWLLMILILVISYAGIGLLPIDFKEAKFEHDRRLMAVAFTHMSEYGLGIIAIYWVGRKLVKYEK